MKIQVSKTYAWEKEIARLNKKAARIGIAPITFTNWGQVTVEKTVLLVSEGREVGQQKVPVQVTEYEVVVPTNEQYRWEFCATIIPMEGANVRAFVDSHVKGFDTTPWENGDPCRCDHCHSRRHRNLTYVVRNKDDSRLLQLGRNCFADYVGKDGLQRLEFVAFVIAWLEECENEGEEGGVRGSMQGVPVRNVIATAEAIAENDGGWKNNYYGESGELVNPGTHRRAADVVRGGIAVYDSSFRRLEKLYQDVNDPIWARVDEVLEEVKVMEVPEEDDFARSIVYCAGFQFVPMQKASLVAYTAQFLRSHKLSLLREAKRATMTHVGNVGKRQLFTALTCRKIIDCEGFYGITSVHIFEDAAGNELVWRKSGHGDIKEGDVVNLKAFVKEHGEYKGIPQTIITRAVVQ